MPRYRVYLYECETCDPGERFERLVVYEERDSQVCESCDSPLTRRPSGATMNTRKSATYVDGKDRGDDYRKLKEAGKIEAEMCNLPPAKRGEHEREIGKLRRAKK